MLFNVPLVTNLHICSKLILFEQFTQLYCSVVFQNRFDLEVDTGYYVEYILDAKDSCSSTKLFITLTIILKQSSQPLIQPSKVNQVQEVVRRLNFN